jgi:hypothetical protein
MKKYGYFYVNVQIIGETKTRSSAKFIDSEMSLC